MPAHRSSTPSATALRSRRYTQKLKDQAEASEKMATWAAARAGDLESRAVTAETVLQSIPAVVLDYCRFGHQSELLRLIEIGRRADAAEGVRRRALAWLLQGK